MVVTSGYDSKNTFYKSPKFEPNFLTLKVQLSVVQMLNGEIVNQNYLVIEDGATELLRSPTELLRLEPRSS